MQVIQNTLDFQFDKKHVVALGKFDGVHRGHLLILNKLWEYHEKSQLDTAVVTFDMTPLEILTGKNQEVLTTLKEKELVLEKAGVDTMVVLPFSKELAAMEPEDFIRDILVGRMKMCVIVVGEDCTFGHNAKGNVELLKELSGKYGYKVIVYEKLTYDGDVISSSRLRDLVKDGKMVAVKEMSRQPYFLYGNALEHGGIRMKFGFPYCIMEIPEGKVAPPSGLYYSKVMNEDIFYPSLSFVSASRRLIGNYLFEADRVLGYDNISVGLFKFIRTPLPSIDPFSLKEEELREQFKNDIFEALKWHRENKYIPEDVC